MRTKSGRIPKRTRLSILSGRQSATNTHGGDFQTKPEVAILDVDMGNLWSLKQALIREGAHAVFAKAPDDLASADKIILPGVGAFGVAIDRLKGSGLADALKARIAEGAHLLGICLGMQLLAEVSEEGGDHQGLSLIPGRVTRLESKINTERIPHAGWNNVQQSATSSLFQNIPDERDFYFVHSYRFVPEDPSNILATTPYCGEFVSAIKSKRVTGVQFHPEKSQRDGLQLLKNFIHSSVPIEC